MSKRTKTEANPKMKCGHTVMDYELTKEGGVVFIRYRCNKDCWTEWGSVGEAPYWDDLEMKK